MLVFGLGSACLGHALAQTATDTNAPGIAPSPAAVTNAPPMSEATATNQPPASPAPAPLIAVPPAPTSPLIATAPARITTAAIPAVTPPSTAPASSPIPTVPATSDWPLVGALLTLASLGGFVLYQCGLTRAKNCAHTSTVLLVGVAFALIGYWMGGFAVQMGGIGDAHAVLAQPILPAEKSSLDHELGFLALGHYWGLMGSTGYFLMTEANARAATAALFLGQAALLAIAVAAALGAGLERGRLLAATVGAFLIGAFIYPIMANWVWGGGWLATLGREYGLGHGFLDLAGAGVVHETAGTLALVIAITLGPRYGRFGRRGLSKRIPGHNVPFQLLGALILLISWTASNGFAYSGTASADMAETPATIGGLAAANTLLAALGGIGISFLLAAFTGQRPEPALLCRGLLGGAIASCGCSAWIDPWAAFIIGACAGLLVQAGIAILERLRIDDPTGAIATHGTAGAWGALATGIFANGSVGNGLNGVDGPVRGLLFGGAWHQLAAQLIGCVTAFVVVFILGFLCLGLIQKILGNRLDAADEITGADWHEVGALGYQPDIDPEEISRHG
jgi:ammonium transporter, Amt family